MSIITTRNIEKKFGPITVLSDVSFSLGRGQKVALVGRNGSGKSTLLKIIASLIKPDSGAVEIPGNICLGYLPQDTSLMGNESVSDYLRQVSGIAGLERQLEDLTPYLNDAAILNQYGEIQQRYEHLGGYSFEHRMKTLLSGFGLDSVHSEQPLNQLSSGQKSKIVLAGILLTGVDLLLLDEPTNNLDLPALIWLEDYLSRSKATAIVVSHDRRFLDRMVGKVFEIDWQTRHLSISNGTYSDYLTTISKRLEKQRREFENQQEEIERLTQQARQLKSKADQGSNWKGTDNDKFLKGFKQDRSARSSKVAKSLEKRIELMDKVEKPIEREPLKILFKLDKKHGSLEITTQKLVAGYSNGFSVGPISLDILFGSRIAILGLNGAGKSTLLKTITGQLDPLGGKVKIPSGLVIGNLMQEHESLPRQTTPLEFLMERTNLSQSESYAQLIKYGLTTDLVRRPTASLSPGGQARLLLALFSALSVNALVLDEPTNHLDIEAQEALEEALASYEGTVILVSHDRHLLEKTKLDSVYTLENGRLLSIPSYHQYIKAAEARAHKLIEQL